MPGGHGHRCMSFRLAHLSDLHLGPMPRVNPRALLNQRVLGYVSWQRRRYRVHRREVLDALVADLREQAPDHVAITGDLVNISLPAEFVQAAVWLRQLGTPDGYHGDPRQPRRLCRGEVARGLGALVGLYVRRRGR